MKESEINYIFAKERAKSLISGYLDSISKNSAFYEMLNYSFSSESKMIRPAIVYGVAQAEGLEVGHFDTYALAIELLHLSSLIHDDLPALDNDSERRGKPSCHVTFGEGKALLFADFLISEAFRLVSRDYAPEQAKVFTQLLSEAFSSLCEGQLIDLSSRENHEELSNDAAISHFDEITLKKTGALFDAAIMGPVSVLNDEEKLKSWRTFSINVSLLFQIRDDLLDWNIDVKEGADKELNYVTLLGEDQARVNFQGLFQSTIAFIDSLDHPTPLLSDIFKKLAL